MIPQVLGERQLPCIFIFWGIQLVAKNNYSMRLAASGTVAPPRVRPFQSKMNFDTTVASLF
jgi:hypothetical protein